MRARRQTQQQRGATSRPLVDFTWTSPLVLFANIFILAKCVSMNGKVPHPMSTTVMLVVQSVVGVGENVMMELAT